MTLSNCCQLIIIIMVMTSFLFPILGPKRIHTRDVSDVASMVPVGIDFCASARSADLFEPAIIPEQSHFV